MITRVWSIPRGVDSATLPVGAEFTLIFSGDPPPYDVTIHRRWHSVRFRVSEVKDRHDQWMRAYTQIALHEMTPAEIARYDWLLPDYEMDDQRTESLIPPGTFDPAH